jgi:hypothetical protein
MGTPEQVLVKHAVSFVEYLDELDFAGNNQ